MDWHTEAMDALSHARDEIASNRDALHGLLEHAAEAGLAAAPVYRRLAKLALIIGKLDGVISRGTISGNQ